MSRFVGESVEKSKTTKLYSNRSMRSNRSKHSGREQKEGRPQNGKICASMPRFHCFTVAREIAYKPSKQRIGC
jgi:hypothetical protein